jgi:hypothetical protein
MIIYSVRAEAKTRFIRGLGYALAFENEGKDVAPKVETLMEIGD